VYPTYYTTVQWWSIRYGFLTSGVEIAVWPFSVTQRHYSRQVVRTRASVQRQYELVNWVVML